MKKNIKIISLISIVSFSLIGAGIYSIQADDAKAPVCNDIYSGAIAKCIEANKAGNSREIEDFVCISNNSTEKIAYNIVLDYKFKEIDKKIKTYLESLEKNKTEYFGVGAQKTFLDGENDLNKIFAEPNDGFYKQYRDVCNNNEIVKEAIACLNPATSLNASYFIKNTNGDNLCMNLAKTKLAVFRQIASDLLKINKQQVKRDYTKEYMQNQRTKYDDLIEKMSVNKNYINKINNKWNVKEPNPN